MSTYPVSAPEAFNQGVDCQTSNEWCLYQEPHEHGGFACSESCPCRDSATTAILGVTPLEFGWNRA